MRIAPARPSARRFEIDWVIVSLEGMRRWGLRVFLLLVAGSTVLVGLYLLHEPVERRAERALRRATTLQSTLRNTGLPSGLFQEFEVASNILAEARLHFERRDFTPSLVRAEDALRRFELVSGLANQDFVGSGQVISVEGRVDVQRTNQTRWERAREKQPLYNGDFVKTGSDGTAEILFSDGTVFRVASDSLLEVHRDARSSGASSTGEVRVKVGQVNVYTAMQPSSVVTDAARADVQRDSRVGVEVAEDSSTTIAAYAGSAYVSSTAGQRMELSSRQAVSAAADGGLGPRRPVPEPPFLLTPASGHTVNLDETDRLTVSWRPVPTAPTYVLQVSRSRLFKAGTVDLETAPRPDTQASLRIILPGSYFWRAAAVSESGIQSEWSASRSFRATHGVRMEELADTTPPRLEVQRATQMGNLALIQGVTEPGATVTVHGEGVEVTADGRFIKTVALNQEGRITILIRATDPAGNVTEHRETILVEVY